MTKDPNVSELSYQSKSARRVVLHFGIFFNGCRYCNYELLKFKGLTLEFLLNPADLGAIEVLRPRSGGSFTVPRVS